MLARFHLEKLEELMRDFYTLTKVRIVIYDDAGRSVCAYPAHDCEFCACLKANRKAKKLCDACDEEALRIGRDLASPHIYECHAGLTEAVFPLRYGDIRLGSIMFGQIVDKETKKTSSEKLIAYASRFTDRAEELFEKIPAKKSDQIRAAAKLMETCACYLWVNEMVRFDRENLLFRLTDYVRENLSSDLSAEAICDEFSISRSRLYRLSEEYFGMGIAAYVRKKRIEEATRLLANGFSVAGAADAVGISDYNYFSKVYKRETGKLPSKMKKASENSFSDAE